MACLKYIRTAIREFQQWKEEQESEASQGEEESEEEESEEEVKRIGQIPQEVLRLCITLLNQPLQDNKYKNIIISRLAVLGIRAD